MKIERDKLKTIEYEHKTKSHSRMLMATNL